MNPEVGERLAVTDRDEAHHEHGGTPGWTERLAFWFFDDAAGLGGVARLVFSPVERSAEGTINLFMPGEAVVTVLAREKMERPGSSVGRIAFERLDALSRWRVRCRDVALVFPKATAAGLPRAGERTGAAAQVDLEVNFDAWMPPSGSVARERHIDEMNFVQVTSSGHFEQAGRATGRVRVGTKQATIAGTSIRERSWGAADPTASHASRWLAAAFGPAFSFGARAVSIGGGVRHTGWVCLDGELVALASLRLETEEDERAVRSVRLELTDAAGTRHDVEGEIVATVPLRDGGARVQQSLVRYGHAGLASLGLAEFVDRA